MLSKNTIKLINSLAYKKYRTKENLFIVEGDKNITELLENNNIKVEKVYITDQFNIPSDIEKSNLIEEIDQKEIKKISQLKNPQNSFAICEIPLKKELPNRIEGLSFYLDNIQDPGNLGTILRICDWFNMKYLFCSMDTVDIYNSKSIQASMGSYARVHTHYIDIEVLQDIVNQHDISIAIADMDGENIYNFSLKENSLIILGNEGNGVSKEILKLIKDKISIPKFGEAESLNVSIAAAIFSSEYSRRFY